MPNRIASITPVGESAFPRLFTRLGTKVLFGANDGVTGDELHGLPLALTGATLVEPYGRGCAGTGGRTPILTANGLPTIGNAGFGVGLADARGNSAALLFLGRGSWDVPLGGGCSSLVAAPYLHVAVAATDGAGAATLPIAVPADPLLAGAEVDLQFLVVDPAGALNGLASLTQGLLLVLGR